jgi:hypothetical protein
MSGLLNKLTTQGSNQSKYDGTTPPINPLSTKNSLMHADPAGNPGYSIDGNLQPIVNMMYQDYDDGALNLLPTPTLLDRDKGKPHSTPLKYRNPETGATYP